MSDIKKPIKQQEPMLLAVAPNGATKQYADHANLPITPDELAATAVSCVAAGAGMMHIHVRDQQKEYQHCLDAKKYSEVFAAIRERVGRQLFLQATTEAVGKYTADEQMAMVRELAEQQINQPPFGVSLAVRELMNENITDAVIADFFRFMQAHYILPQLILYDVADRKRLQILLQSGVLPGCAYPCLFVLGRYHKKQVSHPTELLPFFTDLYGISRWMGCAFGAREADVAQAAALLGGDMRLGYENNTLLRSGQVSADNAALITQTAETLASLQRRLATPDEVLAMMTPDGYN